MTQNPLLDPNFLRRQREKRIAQKQAAMAAQTNPAVITPAVTAPVSPQTLAQARQKAIDAHIQELLRKSDQTIDTLK